ncbi:probable deoxycytidylate deaminase, partial [Trichinella spiralis]|uniref:probable deoxycytidylate deaminase n=1 Tax=Trichinella spiralis TaxID=6334 RepID=UPI0001EFE7E4
CTKYEMTLDTESFFMGIACLSSKRSKDPVTQVGACIANSSDVIISTGYNGMPVGCDDNVLPWGKSLPNPLETKHPFVCHAELNAFLNASTSELSGCRDKSNKWEMMASRKMFDESGVKYRPFSCSVSNVILELQPNTSDTVDTVINTEKCKTNLGNS